MDIQTILIAVIGGGAVGFVEFLIRRHDEKKGKNSEILKAIQNLDHKINSLERKMDEEKEEQLEKEAINRRKDILRFTDELIEERGHSKDSWDQIMDDITEYERYTEKHPNFKNGKAAASIEHIKKSYTERLEKHDFI